MRIAVISEIHGNLPALEASSPTSGTAISRRFPTIGWFEHIQPRSWSGSEAGSPHARYAILAIDEHHVSADVIAILYDWHTASARAEKNNRPEWAYGLKTG